MGISSVQAFENQPRGPEAYRHPAVYGEGEEEQPEGLIPGFERRHVLRNKDDASTYENGLAVLENRKQEPRWYKKEILPPEAPDLYPQQGKPAFGLL
jgi:hypothetical protein